MKLELILTLSNETKIKLTSEEAKDLRDQLNILFPVKETVSSQFVPYTITGPSTLSGTTSVPFCDHVYPSPWFGITPPPCMKCGK